MSSDACIEHQGRWIWAWDEPFGMWMRYVIEALEEIAPRAWTEAELADLRGKTCGPFPGLAIDELTEDQKRAFCAAGREACARLAEQRVVSRDPSDWEVVEGYSVIQGSGGPDERDTAPIVELGHGVIALAEGRLEPAPPFTQWYFGLYEGRTTIPRFGGY
jgi:hypothetical protein